MTTDPQKLNALGDECIKRNLINDREWRRLTLTRQGDQLHFFMDLYMSLSQTRNDGYDAFVDILEKNYPHSDLLRRIRDRDPSLLRPVHEPVSR